MLAPWKKDMTNLDSIIKSRDITLPTKVHIVKAIVLSVVMYRCESWTIKKAECQRMNAFELWFWRTLESPLDCKEITPGNSKGNQPWIFIGKNDAEAEAPVLWPPDARSRFIGKDPDAGEDLRANGEEGSRGWDWLYSITESMNLNLSKLQEIVKDREGWHATVLGVTKSQTWLRDWTTAMLGAITHEWMNGEVTSKCLV